jgi:nucleotide-binding universal stress UspA family protein
MTMASGDDMTIADHDTGADTADEFRIVVGVDGSESAERAMERAVAEAIESGALLHIVSVRDVSDAMGSTRGTSPRDVLEDASAVALGEALMRVNELEPSLVVKGQLELGEVGPVLVQLSWDASLLVVGWQGRGGHAGANLGSASEYCAQHSHCPLAIVP